MSLVNLAETYLGSAARSYREASNYPRPICRVVVNGNDITGTVEQRLISIELTDNRGIEADQLEITLSDHDGLLAIPRAAPACNCGWAGATPA
ncbi:Phage protein D [Pseudomonas aeruginosa]|nr:Phage protein D [Pseudomonas aeruginosa]